MAVARSRVHKFPACSPTGLAESSSLSLRTGYSPQVALHPSLRKRSYLFWIQGGNVTLVGTYTLQFKRLQRRTKEGILTLRKRDIVRMREGKLIAGSELAGCSLAVEIDGGRMKMRGAMSPSKGECQLRENVEENEFTTAIVH